MPYRDEVLAGSSNEDLFISSRGNALTRHTLGDIINKLGNRIGVKIHPHMLKHTCAVSMIKNGGNPFVVQNHLGHSTNAMTKHYCQLNDTEKADAYKKCCPTNQLTKAI